MENLKQSQPINPLDDHEHFIAEVEGLREQFLNAFYETYEGTRSAATFPKRQYERMMVAADWAWDVVSCKIIQGDVPIEEFHTMAGCMSWFYAQIEESHFEQASGSPRCARHPRRKH